MKLIGLDIGTTTICGALTDGDSKKLLDTRTLPNDTWIPSPHAWERLQDPGRILNLCRRIVSDWQDEYDDICAVGVTGQMHGILFLDGEGQPCSPLFTWQDGRGGLPPAPGLDVLHQLPPAPGLDSRMQTQPATVRDGFGQTQPAPGPGGPGQQTLTSESDDPGQTQTAPEHPGRETSSDAGRPAYSCAEYLTELTGWPMSSGYGITTWFCLSASGQLPEQAASLCTIPDFVAMSLAGAKRPVMHPSMAASLGMFDLCRGCFDEQALQKAGLDPSLLPVVSPDERPYRGSRPGTFAVAPALGDNQASFLGSVSADSTVLANVGTGGQLSVLCPALPKDFRDTFSGLELRPYIGGAFLAVGSALCSGSAYGMLKDFFRETLTLFGQHVPDDMYTVMNRAVADLYETSAAGAASCIPPLAADGRTQAGPNAASGFLRVDTRFRGSRAEPLRTGAIAGIRPDNFTPAHLTLGFLQGICRELYDFYSGIPADIRTGSVLTGSGNGIRKNPLLQKMLSEMFGMPLRLAPCNEEAACGSALFALRCISG